MKTYFARVGLVAVLLGSAAMPLGMTAAEKPAPLSAAASATRLAELKKQLAATEARIVAIKARIKESADRKAAARDRAKDKKDSIAEVSPSEMLELQHATEEKAQLEALIAAITKAESDASGSERGAKKG